MKMNLVPGLLLLAATTALAAPPEAIQRVTLDERVVITVPVSTNRVTTISFPGPIAAIDAVSVTADGKFQLAHTKASSPLTVFPSNDKPLKFLKTRSFFMWQFRGDCWFRLIRFPDWTFRFK
jgi:hypothetical protein